MGIFSHHPSTGFLPPQAEKKLTVDLSKLPTPCRSMAQAARQCVVSSTATDESKGPKMTSVGAFLTVGFEGVEDGVEKVWKFIF